MPPRASVSDPGALSPHDPNAVRHVRRGILARTSTPTGGRDDHLLDPRPEEVVLFRDLLRRQLAALPAGVELVGLGKGLVARVSPRWDWCRNYLPHPFLGRLRASSDRVAHEFEVVQRDLAGRVRLVQLKQTCLGRSVGQ
jgi:hypothetical protein